MQRKQQLSRLRQLNRQKLRQLSRQKLRQKQLLRQNTPAPTATAVPTYAVSGTVDAGVKSVTLTDKAEAENTITGTIEDTAVTFTGVKAGTYTVSAVAKDDYKDLTVTPQEITVSGNLAGVFTVKTTAKVKSAVTTTVTGGTATVTGANRFEKRC